MQGSRAKPTHEGKQIKEVTARFMRACSEVEKVLGKMGLQARGTGGVDSANTGGTWDISNADRIGKGEVDLVNILIEGAAKLVQWETLLDDGKVAQVDAELKAVMSK